MATANRATQIREKIRRNKARLNMRGMPTLPGAIPQPPRSERPGWPDKPMRVEPKESLWSRILRSIIHFFLRKGSNK